MWEIALFLFPPYFQALTTAAVGRLLEEGKLDLDRPVRDYVNAWPEKHPVVTSR